MTQPLLFSQADGVATIVLNRPAVRNAIDPQMACMLGDAFITCARDDAVRVVVVTGSGPKAFCSGGDLASMLPLLGGHREPRDEWDRRILHDKALQQASGLRDFPFHKPVIAAVNGACLAAGTELLLGTDIRIAADTATFGLPEATRGLIPFGGSMARLPRQVPFCIAMELMLTGRTMTAAEALAAGLVNQVVPAGDVMPRALAIAGRIAANGPVAVQRIKQTVLASSGRSLQESFALEDESSAVVFATEDAQEGPRAFVEKRLPVYRGR